MTKSKNKNLIVIAKVGDYRGFERASDVIKIQEFIFEKEGKIVSARKVVSEDEVLYSMRIHRTDAHVEEETPITPGFFNNFVHIADTCTVRNQYVFEGSVATVNIDNQMVELPPVSFRVDVFTRPDGRESDYVQIEVDNTAIEDAVNRIAKTVEDLDIEVKVTHLPFKPQDAFIVDEVENLSEEQLETLELMTEEIVQTAHGGMATIIRPSLDRSKQEEEKEKKDDQDSNSQKAQQAGTTPVSAQSGVSTPEPQGGPPPAGEGVNTPTENQAANEPASTGEDLTADGGDENPLA